MKERYNVFSCAHQVRMPTIEYLLVNCEYRKKYTNMYFVNGFINIKLF